MPTELTMSATMVVDVLSQPSTLITRFPPRAFLKLYDRRFVFDGFMVGTTPGADVFQTASAGCSSSAHVATTSATGAATHVGAIAATVLQTAERALHGLTLVDRVHTPVSPATETPQQSTRHMDGDVDTQEKYNASSCVFVAK